jgi:cytochrome c556
MLDPTLARLYPEMVPWVEPRSTLDQLPTAFDSERRKMLRKFAFLAVALIAVTGLSLAATDDDDSPTTKLMEKINASHRVLTKATRNAPEYKKTSSQIPKAVEEIVKHAKEAREIKEPAEHVKKPIAEYQKLMDEMIKSAEDLSKLVSKSGTTQVKAKEAYNTYNKTCGACHDVFKKDE